MTQNFGLLYHENGKRCKCVISLLPLSKPLSFLLIPIRKNLPVSCRAKRTFPSGETLILPASRDSRYNTLHFASKAVCQRGVPFGNPLFCREVGATHKIAAAPHPSKTQAGGMGQPVLGADLCRLLAYMGTYRIAHINRSNLLLPYEGSY